MISYLPRDVIEEILSRVPVTSLRRLRSTCKLWYHHALFKDAFFIKKHFDKTVREYHDFLLMGFRVYSVSSNLNGIHNNSALLFQGKRSLIDTDSNSEVDLSRVFHCDGISLCTTKGNRCVVWNPFSGQTRLIELINRHHKMFEVYVLGYNKKELFHSYKILRFKDIHYQTLEIYELSSNSWRNLDVSPQANITCRGVSLKGNTYWVSRRIGGLEEYSLLSFDFSTESFQHLYVPFHQEAGSIDAMTLSVVREEHLSLFYLSRKTRKMKIWVTNEIETTCVSWCKFLTVDLKPDFPDIPMFSSAISFFIDEEKKVVVCFEKVRYDTVYIVGENGYSVSINYCLDDGITNCWPAVFTYVPRLV